MRGEDFKGLTGSAACTGVDGFIPLVGAGHGEGALVHAVFAAAKRRAARLEGRAAVGVRSAWNISDRHTRILISYVRYSRLISKLSLVGSLSLTHTKKKVCKEVVMV